MDMEIYKAMCYSLAKAYTTGVRIYQDETPLYYYSSYYIEPDPFGPFLHQITDSDQEAGIITTSLYQFYAFLTLKPGLRLIIGPTRALNEDGKAMDELLATLGVGKDEKNHYVRWLCSAPVIHIERLAWLIVSLMTSIQKRPFPVEKVWKEKPSVSMEESVRIAYTERTMNNLEDMGISLSHYIQQKKIEEAKKLLQFSDRSLSEIASLLNFSSQSHFQTIFRKSTGVTPLSYRKQTKMIS